MTICQRLIPNKEVFYYIGAQIEANNINAKRDTVSSINRA